MLDVISTVIFDLDDTLMDHQSAADRAVLHWAESMGMRGDPDELAGRWAQVSNRHYSRYQRRELSFTEQQQARVREFLPHLDLRSDADAQSAFDGYVELYRAAWTTFPDAVPTLRRARSAGLRVGVLTNGEEAQQRAKLIHGQLDPYVDVFIASSTIPWSKPDARAFHYACDQLAGEPGSTLMVGDSLAYDIHGARSAGLPAVLLDRWGQHSECDLRGGVRVDSLAALTFEPVGSR